jgi:hypothetical protein
MGHYMLLQCTLSRRVAASSPKDLGMARPKNLNSKILERYEYDAYGNPYTNLIY